MGSSAKKKKDKKKDFKKPKLRVGKARPKPSNVTDTSFKSKSIVLAHQSLSTTAPSQSTQFSHHLSLLTSSSSTQRRDSLAFLTTAITSRPVDSTLPQPVSVLLPELYRRIPDISNGVRAQLLRLLSALPPQDIEPHVGQLLIHTRAGLTHIAADIRSSAIDLLSWELEICPNEVVSCAGGWVKTLKCLITLLRWHSLVVTNDSKAARRDGSWTTLPAPNLGNVSSEGKLYVKTLNALAAMLHAGLSPTPESEGKQLSKWPFPLRNVECHMIPKRSNAFAHLNLFGPRRDEEGEMYVEREERQKVFHRRFGPTVEGGHQAAIKEGGEVGRAAARIGKVLAEGMKDFDTSE